MRDIFALIHFALGGGLSSIFEPSSGVPVRGVSVGDGVGSDVASGRARASCVEFMEVYNLSIPVQYGSVSPYDVIDGSLGELMFLLGSLKL